VLEAMFSGRHQLDKFEERIFIDRDPKIFRLLLNYLRDGIHIENFTSSQENELYLKELHYWGLPNEYEEILQKV
jgi:hypothetical protein